MKWSSDRPLIWYTQLYNVSKILLLFWSLVRHHHHHNHHWYLHTRHTVEHFHWRKPSIWHLFSSSWEHALTVWPILLLARLAMFVWRATPSQLLWRVIQCWRQWPWRNSQSFRYCSFFSPIPIHAGMIIWMEARWRALSARSAPTDRDYRSSMWLDLREILVVASICTIYYIGYIYIHAWCTIMQNYQLTVASLY